MCLLAFVLVGYFKAQTLPPPSQKEGAWAGVSSPWLNPWTTFDSRHYIDIAQAGYNPLRSAFFPLYPLLMRLLAGPHASQNTLALVGILVSNAAFLTALWLLYLLTRDEWGEDIARRAVWIEAFFPAAAFSAAVYTESLFLALSLGVFWFARQKKWWLCALFGLLTGLTRNSGPVLFLALLFDRPKAPLSKREQWRRATCALTPMIGFVGVQLYLRAQFGSAASSLAVQKVFRRTPSWPWKPLLHDAHNLLVHPATWLDFVTFPQLLGCLGTFALLWMYRRRFSPGKLLFLGLVLVSSLVLAWGGEPETISTLRYLFGAFPAAQLLALASQEKLPSKRATLYGAAAAFALFFVHSYLFGLKDFLG